MVLTREEKEILARAKKIEAEVEGLQPHEEMETKLVPTPTVQKDLGNAGQVILVSPRIANFTGRSLIDDNAPIVIDTTDEILELKKQLAKLTKLIEGGE